MTLNGAQALVDDPPGVPDQRNVALMNIYIANTTKTLNQLAGVCERKVHDVDRRLQRISINMSQLEVKVDSAVASQSAAALRDVPDAAGAAPSQVQAEPTVEPAPSTASVRSDAVEEIDIQQHGSRAGTSGSGKGG